MTTAITVSERAARRIGEILKSEGDGAMLRISVEGGGCSGFQYKFDVDHDKAEDDLVIAREGAVVLVDPASVPFLAGSEVDFVDDLLGVSLLRLLVIIVLRGRRLMRGHLRRLGRVAMQRMHRRRLLVLRLVIVFLRQRRRRQRGFVARALHPCRRARRSNGLFFRRIVLLWHARWPATAAGAARAWPRPPSGSFCPISLASSASGSLSPRAWSAEGKGRS